MKILIVDDDEIARLSLAAILRPLGAQIVQAADGQQAWDVLAAGLRPTLCCSDILMPRMDGLQLLQRVRADRFLADLPVVLISSASDRDTVTSAIASGVAGYVVKPFKGVATRTTIERIVRETRPLRSEAVAATRRRLKVTLDDLARMLQRLGAEAASLQEAFTSRVRPEDARETLQRLRSGAQVLGLWKAGSILEQAIPDGTADADRERAVRELQWLVEEQLVDLREKVVG